METEMQIHNQLTNEERFYKGNIPKLIKDLILGDENIQIQMEEAVELLEEYRNTEYSYESKNQRMALLREKHLEPIVEAIFITIGECTKPTLLSAVAPVIAPKLEFEDEVWATTTVAEMISIISDTDAWDVVKESKHASLMVISHIKLNREIETMMENACYLPPMVCEPLDLTCNGDSGYLSHENSLLLGRDNHHNGDISLDVLNRMNKVPLSLSTEFLSTVEEEPTFEIETREQQEQWDDFKRQSYYFYSLMVNQGNRFYMTHKVDTRGRIYSQGYHINPQGTAFKKAMIELANKEMLNEDY